MSPASLLRLILPVALLAPALIAADPADPADPFLGRWKLDLDQSKLTGQTIEIRAMEGNAYSFKEDEHTDVIFADGLDHPTHFGDTMSVAQKTPDTWAITWKRGDTVLMETVWKLSRDGKTMTYTATGTRPNGQRFHNQMIAKRTGGGPGLAGIWETTSVRLSSPREIVIAPYGNSGHIITYAGRQQTVRMNFDGKDYADEGPTVPEGSTSSGRRIDTKTIETTEKVKGKIVEVARATISEDGRTQTIVVTEPGDPTPVTLVYRRESK